MAVKHTNITLTGLRRWLESLPPETVVHENGCCTVISYLRHLEPQAEVVTFGWTYGSARSGEDIHEYSAPDTLRGLVSEFDYAAGDERHTTHGGLYPLTAAGALAILNRYVDEGRAVVE
jgi:hypothetical protein